MSIASEITRIKTQKELLRQAMNDKGCSISQDATLESFVSAVNDISGGGGSQEDGVNVPYTGWENNPFCIENIDSSTSTISVNIIDEGNTRINHDFYYKINNGEWILKTPPNNSGTYYSFSINAGDKVYIKGANHYWSLSETCCSVFSFSKDTKVSGNILSLTQGYLNGYDFYYLFGNMKNNPIGYSGASTDVNNSLKDISGLVIPQTEKYSCYYMFRDCTGLTSLPSGLLPATNLADYCYYYMFYGCTGLTSLPSGLLPANILQYCCYYYMFRDCTGLTSLPSGLLPATILTDYCYYNMFSGCTGLTSLPSNLLPATNLANGCYYYMFSGCTGLTSLPSGLLPATILRKSCYSNMFYGCTGLTSLPSGLLPATILAPNCYSNMFYGCTKITTAPDLLVYKLVATCYSYMFYGCSKLNRVKMMATDVNATNCLNNFITNVSGSGTFIYNINAPYITVSKLPIPSGWSHQGVSA